MKEWMNEAREWQYEERKARMKEWMNKEIDWKYGEVVRNWKGIRIRKISKPNEWREWLIWKENLKRKEWRKRMRIPVFIVYFTELLAWEPLNGELTEWGV